MIVHKGIDWQRTISVTSAAGVRQSLTGATIVATVKRRSSDVAALLTYAVGTGITLATQSGETLGDMTLAITGAASLGLSAANHVLTVTVLLSGAPVPQVVIDRYKLQVVDV